MTILPGLSGRFFLLTSGEYENILNYVSSFNFFAIFIICFGTISGLFFTAKLMEKMFKKYKEETTAVILGIILGTTIEIFPKAITGEKIFFDILFFIIGGMIVLKLSKIKK